MTRTDALCRDCELLDKEGQGLKRHFPEAESHVRLDQWLRSPIETRTQNAGLCRAAVPSPVLPHRKLLQRPQRPHGLPSPGLGLLAASRPQAPWR